MTIREALTCAAAALATEAELRNDAKRDAELLMLNVLDVSRATLVTDAGRALTPVQQKAYQSAIMRRMKHEPIQYILGAQEFYGLALKVTPAVLIPRPETEHLVEAVLARVRKSQPIRIADVGTGSGAIAIALARLLPLAEIAALDMASAALTVARENARKHDVAKQIRFLESDLLDAVAGERFDAVVSNPPYVPENEREQLYKQVREWEPAYALFAGPTGMEVYRRLAPAAWAVLKPGGLLAMEIGYGQRDAIAELLNGWCDVNFVDDLQRIPRVAVARKG